MTHIQLKRSGGQIGKTLQSSMDIDMDEKDLISGLNQFAPVKNPLARDEFNYYIVVNGNKSFPIDIAQLKGRLKKIVNKLENDLRVSSL
jgi:hypothetical protein